MGGSCGRVLCRVFFLQGWAGVVKGREREGREGKGNPAGGWEMEERLGAGRSRSRSGGKNAEVEARVLLPQSGKKRFWFFAEMIFFGNFKFPI